MSRLTHVARGGTDDDVDGYSGGEGGGLDRRDPS